MAFAANGLSGLIEWRLWRLTNDRNGHVAVRRTSGFLRADSGHSVEHQISVEGDNQRASSHLTDLLSSKQETANDFGELVRNRIHGVVLLTVEHIHGPLGQRVHQPIDGLL